MCFSSYIAIAGFNVYMTSYVLQSANQYADEVEEELEGRELCGVSNYYISYRATVYHMPWNFCGRKLPQISQFF